MTTKGPLKIMKNAFNIILKALFVLKIFTFLSSLFGYVEKRLDKKIKFKLRVVPDLYLFFRKLYIE